MNIPAEQSSVLTPRFENKPEIRLAGSQRRYGCDDKSGIPGQWGEFVPRIARISHRLSEVAYGVCANGTETEFDYFCGVEIPAGSTVPAGFTGFSISAQRYAVFDHRGRVEGIVDTVHRIFTEWLPTCGCTVATEPQLIERYSEDFDPVTNAGSVEIWIPLRT